MASTEKPRYPELLSLAVHEFRTPASVVGGYLRMLQRDSDSFTERQRKMIDEAEKSCARLVALIGELSDVSKLDAGIVTLNRQPLDVFPLLAEVAEHVQEGKDREVRLELRGEPAGATIAGDGPRLRSALDAVCRAILREKAGPCVVVAQRRLESKAGTTSAVIVVAEEQNVQAAYDGAPGAFDEKRGGLGLALPLARRVIEGLGGRIWSPASQEGSDDALARAAILISLPVTEPSR
jgi:two-component system, OmpR family, sensor kinase